MAVSGTLRHTSIPIVLTDPPITLTPASSSWTTGIPPILTCWVQTPDLRGTRGRSTSRDRPLSNPGGTVYPQVLLVYTLAAYATSHVVLLAHRWHATLSTCCMLHIAKFWCRLVLFIISGTLLAICVAGMAVICQCTAKMTPVSTNSRINRNIVNCCSV